MPVSRRERKIIGFWYARKSIARNANKNWENRSTEAIHEKRTWKTTFFMVISAVNEIDSRPGIDVN